MDKSIKKKTILVTGATGFIGRHLVRRLCYSGKYRLICPSRFPDKAEIGKNEKVKLVKADLTRKRDLRLLARASADIIIHCAGRTEGNNKNIFHKLNVEATENICKLAVELGVERFIYLSSVSVVSGNFQIPLDEDLDYCSCNNYSWSKVEAEKKVVRYRRKGLPAIILRPAMVYGADEPHAFPLLLKLLRHRFVPIFGSGSSKLQLVYVENVVEAVIFSLKSDKMFKGSFFVADREVLTTGQALQIMARGMGAKPPLSVPFFLVHFFRPLPFVGRRVDFFLKDRAYSIEKLKAAGFTPPYKTEKALCQSCKNYCSNYKNKKTAG